MGPPLRRVLVGGTLVNVLHFLRDFDNAVNPPIYSVLRGRREQNHLRLADLGHISWRHLVVSCDSYVLPRCVPQTHGLLAAWLLSNSVRSSRDGMSKGIRKAIRYPRPGLGLR